MASKTIGGLSPNPWIGSYKHVEGARVRIYLFYGAGASSNLFRSWHGWLAKEFPELELCVFEYPGRLEHKEDLSDDPVSLMKDFDQQIIQSGNCLTDYFSCPFVLIGHSTGARFCYDFIHMITRISCRTEKFYVVGRAPPTVPDMYWVDNQPAGTLPLLKWCAEKLVTSRTEKVIKLYELMDEDKQRETEAVWRSDLRLNAGMIKPNALKYKVVNPEGKLIKKKELESAKMIEIKKAFQGTVFTTGREHVGASGGTWVEVDPEKGNLSAGWLLTHGKSIAQDKEFLEEIEDPSRVARPETDLFWKAPCPIQVHYSTGDMVQPYEDPTGRLAPQTSWAKLTEKEPEFVKHEGMHHDEFIMNEGVMRHICNDVIKVLKLR